MAQGAVEWKVIDGGNGHWYKVIPRDCKTWDQCRLESDRVGGHLATVNSDGERRWVVGVQNGS
jgi:hypothetical protein